MQDPSPNPDTHINARSHTLTHTPCPRENTGVGGWMGFPNYLSRFQQMVRNFLQGRAVAPAARTFAPTAARHVVSSTSPKTPHSCVLWTQKGCFSSPSWPRTSWILNHAFRLSDTFSGTGGGVLQGESVRSGRNRASTHKCREKFQNL